MNPNCTCPQERLYALHFECLRRELQELRERAARLERSLGRGILLLIANLAGVVVTLAHQLI